MRNRVIRRETRQIKKEGNVLDIIVYRLLKTTLQYDELSGPDYKTHVRELTGELIQLPRLRAICEEYLKSEHRIN